MRLAFFHDSPLLFDGDKYYSVTYPYELWKNRYLAVFDSVIVSMRVRDIGSFSGDMLRGYTESGGDGVEMAPVAGYDQLPDMLLKRKRINSEIDDVLRRADVAIVRLPSVIGIMAARRCIALGVPWATEVVACVKDQYNGQGWQGKLLAPYFYRLNQKYVGRADAALYVTQRFLQDRYPTSAPSVGIADAMVSATPDEVLENRLKKIDSEHSPTVFGVVGSLDVGFKGQDVAIRAIARIKDKLPPFELQFLGAGKTDRWRKLANEYGIGENVRFCGTLPSGQPVFDWLDSIDVLILPSLQEGLSRVLTEAICRGCPALASDAGGNSELLNGEFIHRKKDFVKLSEDILRLTGDRELLKRAASENFEHGKSYTTAALDPKRLDFWRDYRARAEKQSGI